MTDEKPPTDPREDEGIDISVARTSEVKQKRSGGAGPSRIEG